MFIKQTRILITRWTRVRFMAAYIHHPTQNALQMVVAVLQSSPKPLPTTEIYRQIHGDSLPQQPIKQKIKWSPEGRKLKPTPPEPPMPSHPVRSVRYLKKVLLDDLQANGRIQKIFIFRPPETLKEQMFLAKSTSKTDVQEGAAAGVLDQTNGIRTWVWKLVEPSEGTTPYEDRFDDDQKESEVALGDELERKWRNKTKGSKKYIPGRKSSPNAASFKVRGSKVKQDSKSVPFGLQTPERREFGFNYGLPKSKKLLKLANERGGDQKEWSYQPKPDIIHLNPRRQKARVEQTRWNMNLMSGRSKEAKEQ